MNFRIYFTYFKTKKRTFEITIFYMKISENNTVIALSKFISNFFNPFTSLVLYFVFYSYKYHNFSQSFHHFLPIFLIIILPASLWIWINVKKGTYSNLDVSNRKQRKSLYIFLNIAMVIYLLYDYLFKSVFDIMVFYLLVLLLFMQLSNFFIKSSMHTALNFYVAALFMSENIVLGYIWLLISCLVGISRIIVKRHTTKEVLMGFLLSAIASFAYLYTFIQLQNG